MHPAFPKETTGKMKKLYLILVSLAAVPLLAQAQQWSVGINALDAANVGTLSAEGSVAASRHITVNASARINPWTFAEGTPDQKQHRHQTYAAGIRWWPWNVYSGWWMGAKAQFQEYNRGGFRSRETEEGDAYGAGLSFGYTWMLHEHVNLEAGAGVWGGYRTYTVYACPTCGRKTDEGAKWFFLPNEAILSLVFVF